MQVALLFWVCPCEDQAWSGTVQLDWGALAAPESQSQQLGQQEL